MDGEHVKRMSGNVTQEFNKLSGNIAGHEVHSLQPNEKRIAGK